jgi:hypothetical protein
MAALADAYGTGVVPVANHQPRQTTGLQWKQWKVRGEVSGRPTQEGPEGRCNLGGPSLGQVRHASNTNHLTLRGNLAHFLHAIHHHPGRLFKPHTGLLRTAHLHPELRLCLLSAASSAPSCDINTSTNILWNLIACRRTL